MRKRERCKRGRGKQLKREKTGGTKRYVDRYIGRRREIDN